MTIWTCFKGAYGETQLYYFFKEEVKWNWCANILPGNLWDKWDMERT